MASSPLRLILVFAMASLSSASAGALQSDYWLAKRARMIETIWGYGATLPSRSVPDSLSPTNVTEANVTEIRWDLGAPGAAALNLSSRVYQVLRSTNGTRAKRAFLLHHGHSEAPEPNGSWWDHYNMSHFLGELADADVFILSMPLYGCNRVPGGPTSHTWFEQFETAGNSPGVNSASTLRFFVEPVVLTTNMALRLGYEEVVLTGKSGGGWTTTLAAAMDPRLALTIPDAGSIPLSFNHTSWDYEQVPAHGPGALYATCDYKCMYVLAGLEAGRVSLQLLHEDDPCCFHGRGRHDAILAYDAAVQRELRAHAAAQAEWRTPAAPLARLSSSGHGWFSTAIVDWNKHEYSARDRRVIAEAWAAYARGAPADAYAALHCDILRAAALPCGV